MAQLLYLLTNVKMFTVIAGGTLPKKKTAMSMDEANFVKLFEDLFI